jgi:hypothetical protein
MATISVDDKVRLAESTVRLWSVEDNVHQGTFFQMTPQLFNVRKTTYQIARHPTGCSWTIEIHNSLARQETIDEQMHNLCARGS